MRAHKLCCRRLSVSFRRLETDMERVCCGQRAHLLTDYTILYYIIFLYIVNVDVYCHDLPRW